MSRKPPAEVARTLRSEVGFGCPVPGCGNPYLEWHHFDPPYADEQHHRPEGMIALCAEHHKKADAGAYTKAQLSAFKANRANAEMVRGAFEWLRNDLLAVVGGILYHETLRPLVVDGQNIVWFNRDTDGYLRLNVRLPSLTAEPRAIIEDNVWTNIGAPKDLRSPPSGKSLEITYPSGDRLTVEFFELGSAEEAFARYQSEALRNRDHLRYPLTSVEINLTIAGAGITLSPRGTTLPNNNQFRGGFISRCEIGFSLNLGLPWRHNTQLSVVPRFPRNAPCPCKSGFRYKFCHGVVR